MVGTGLEPTRLAHRKLILTDQMIQAVGMKGKKLGKITKKGRAKGKRKQAPGWTRDQLAVFGIDGPPPAGWREKLASSELTEAQWILFQIRNRRTGK